MPDSGSTPLEPNRPETLVVVLAGGIGSRFWPVSTPARPKQLLPLGSERPLIVDTIERAERIAGRERIRILTGDEVGRAIQKATGLPDSAFLIEPEARGTCPVLAWAAHEAAKKSSDAVLISLHADHVIDPPEAFVQLLQDAATVAHSSEMLLTVAIPPTRPDVGFGYINPGREVAREGSAECFVVEKFEEKPDLETAARYIDAGFLWNSGIFVWRADTFLSEVRTHAPEIGKALSHLDKGDVASFFAACPNTTVDEAILEPSDRVGTVKATFRWDDVGSWEALTRTRDSDEHGNVSIGDTHVVKGENNVIVAESGSVVLFGVSDLVVVQSGEVAFVTTREQSPHLKKMFPHLPERLVRPDADAS